MNIQIFNSPQFGDIRTAGTAEEPMFCLADLCRVLELRVDGVMPRLKEGGYNRIGVGVQTGVKRDGTPAIQNVEMVFINEQNLYKVIMRSDKPQAEAFQDWVCGEVLPSIRKHGSYVAKSSEKQDVEVLLTWANGVSDMLRLNSSSRLRYIQQIAQPLNLPVPDYTQSMGVLKSATELLRENNLSVSAKEFNRIAVERGYLVEMSRKSKGKDKYFKSVTELGREYGENQVSPHNPRETQPLWYRDRFTDLIKVLGLAIC